MNFLLLIIIILIILIIFYFIYIYSKKDNLIVDDLPFIIVNTYYDSYELKELLNRIYIQFKMNINLYNIIHITLKKEKKRICLNKYNNHIKDLPFLSNGESFFLNKHDYLGNYFSSISASGDSVFLYNDKIKWNSNYDNTFFLKKDEKNQPEHYIIVTHYFYKEIIPALHVNYINKKKGILNDKLFQSFIGFLNYIKQYIEENKIKHFSIAGCSQISSSRWKKVTKIIFKDSVYSSPGTDDKFLTQVNGEKDNYTCFTPDFIIISKRLAPHGVNFSLAELMFDRLPNKYILVAECLTKDKIPLLKVDKSKSIFKEINSLKTIIYIDKTTNSDVNLDNFDLTLINEYHKDIRKTNLNHIYDII